MVIVSLYRNIQINFAEKNWEAEMLIRGEGESQPQRIAGEITLPRGRDIQNG